MTSSSAPHSLLARTSQVAWDEWENTGGLREQEVSLHSRPDPSAGRQWGWTMPGSQFGFNLTAVRVQVMF